MPRNFPKKTCPHCQREMQAHALPKHAPKCPKNPAIYDEIRAALNDQGYANSKKYAADSTGKEHLPSENIMWRTFGTVADMADYYGLDILPHKRATKIQPVNWQHVERYARRISHKIYGPVPNLIPSQDEWDTYIEEGIPPANSLNAMGFSWAELANKLGMKYTQARQKHRLAKFQTPGWDTVEVNIGAPVPLDWNLAALPPKEKTFYHWTFRRPVTATVYELR